MSRSSLFAVGLLPLVVGTARAQAPTPSEAPQTQVQVASKSLSTVPWFANHFLQRFDPVRGRLLEVLIEFTSTVQRDFAIENVSASASAFSFDHSTVMQASGSSGWMDDHDSTRSYAGALPAFDGTNDFAGASGLTEPLEVASTTTTAASTLGQLTTSSFLDSPNGGGILSFVLFADKTLTALTPQAPFVVAFDQRASAAVTLTYVYEQGESFCQGVASGCTPCPCGNEAPAGSATGCQNSSGRGAELVARGRASLLTDTLGFVLYGAPPGSAAFLLSGQVALPANPSAPCFGQESGVAQTSLDGLRCIGGGVRRFGSRACDVDGNVGVTNPGWGGVGNGLVGTGGFLPGQVVLFQAIYRENPMLGCGTGFATTQGRKVTIWL